MKILPFLFLTLLLIPLTGCGNVFYLSNLGWHQALITFRSVPVQEVLENKERDDEAKGKIRFIQEVKHYGKERLGLGGDKSYSKVFDVTAPLLYVVTASEKDRLQLYQWNFPVVGSVTYKSFFTQEGALKEKKFLNEKNLDTFIQRADAYSTLGWLKDPIFSSFFKLKEAILANLILHEMTHSTIYFKGMTDFNEQMATLVGNRGAIDFLTETYGPGSKEVFEAIHIQEDDLLFGWWIDQVYQRLSNFYVREISKNEKLKGREEIFAFIKEEFGGIKTRLKTNGYKDFDELELNNAVLLAYRRYIHQLEEFESIYEYFGQDLKQFIQLFKKIQTSKEDPASFLKRWMKERGITVPASLR